MYMEAAYEFQIPSNSALCRLVHGLDRLEKLLYYFVMLLVLSHLSSKNNESCVPCLSVSSLVGWLSFPCVSQCDGSLN